MLYFYEDKKQVTQMLFQALKSTVAGVEIEALKYEQLANGDEHVTIKYESGYRKVVNVSCDSGLVLMRDVLRSID